MESRGDKSSLGRREGEPSLGVFAPRRGAPLIGAAIGIGIAAKAAEKGGADFLLVLNAGRLRVLGAPSLACMLPINDSNALIAETGAREILGRVSIPVFFGACMFDPRIELHQFLARIKALGFNGVANFPTAIHLSGSFRESVEALGVGFARELEMLRAAREIGLLTFGYAKSRSEALSLAVVEPDLFCLNFGWNAGGAQGLIEDLDLDEIAEKARSIIHSFRRLSPRSACLVEGGPIVTADHMHQVYMDAHADGYVGGSTIDRLPFETSVAQSTSSFKTIGYLKSGLAYRDRRLAALGASVGLLGQSPSVLATVERANYLAMGNAGILIRGERGAGKTTLARAIHAWSQRPGGLYMIDAAASADLEAKLFGLTPEGAARRRLGLLEMERATVLIENADSLPASTLSNLRAAMESGFIQVDFIEGRPLTARIVATANTIDENDDESPFLAQLFCETTIHVAPLRDRLEDLAPIARSILDFISPHAKSGWQLSPSGYRFLFANHWPGNIRELRQILELAVARAKDGCLTYEDFTALDGMVGKSKKPVVEESERASIVAALKGNRFRKSETARALGVTRRTLYNKMRKYGLSG